MNDAEPKTMHMAVSLARAVKGVLGLSRESACCIAGRRFVCFFDLCLDGGRVQLLLVLLP